MPSFDIVSEVDKHELANAVDQANREITTRFDFKNVKATYMFEKSDIKLQAENDFQLKQMLEILQTKLAKRNIDNKCLEIKKSEIALNQARQTVVVKEGLDTPFAKKVVKLIKDANLKVQAAIQGEQVRVTGKKRDDLQEVIAMLRKADLELPLQFENFRD